MSSQKYDHHLRSAWHQFNKRVRDGQVKHRKEEISFEDYCLLKQTQELNSDGSLKSPWHKPELRREIYENNSR